METTHISPHEIEDFASITGFDATEGFYYKKNHDSKGYRKVKHPPTWGTYAMHVKGLQTVALSRYTYTKIYSIDIDARNNKKIGAKNIVRQLVEDLGTPFYLEYSKTSRGYHLYWYYTDYIHDEFWSTYTNKLKKLNMEIEPKVYKGILRLPYSITYQTAGTYDPESRNLIRSVSSWDEALGLFREKKAIPKTRYIHSIEKTLSLIGERHSMVRDVEYDDVSLPDFSYGEGTRHIQQPKIALYTLRRGGDFFDFERYCEIFDDGTSKDMKKSNVTSMLQRIWSWAELNFDDSYVSKTAVKSNITDLIVPKGNILSTNEQKDLQFILNKAYQIYGIGLQNGKTQVRIVEHAVKVFEFMYAKHKYNEDTKAHYEVDEYQHLNGGLNYDWELRKKVATHYGIQNEKKVMRLLELSGLISVIKTDDGYSWSYKSKRYCKHYRLIKDIRDFLLLNLSKLYINNNNSSTYSIDLYSYNTRGGCSPKHKLYQNIFLDLHGKRLIDRHKYLLEEYRDGKYLE